MSNIIQIFTQYPIIPLFLLANLAIGFWAYTKSKSNSFEDYALASRSLPTAVLVMTLLATFIATGDLSEPGYVVAYGAIELMPLLFFIPSFLLIGAFLAPHFVYFDGAMTMGSVMSTLYGSFAQVITGLVGAVVSLLVISSQIRAIGTISQHLLGVDESSAILCFGVVVVIYSALGGMKAVSYTDVVQCIAAFLVLGWIMQTMLGHVGGAKMALQALPPEKLAFFTNRSFIKVAKIFTFYWFVPTLVLTPPIVQRMLVVQDKKQVSYMWYASALLYGLFWTMLVVIGLLAIVGKESFGLHFSETNDSKDLLLQIIQNVFGKQRWVIGTMFVGLLSVLISTIDSYLHAVGILLIEDFVEPVKKWVGQKPLEATAKPMYARLGIIFVGLVAVAVGLLTKGDLANESFYRATTLTSAMILIPMVIGIVGIKTDVISFASSCILYAVGVAMFEWLGWEVFDYFLVVLPCTIATYFLTHLYIHGGLVMIKRYQYAKAKKVWKLSPLHIGKDIIHWVRTTFNLVHGARVEVSEGRPAQSLTFSLLMFSVYVLGSMVMGGQGGDGFVEFMVSIRFVGIALCCGLMLEGIWPRVLKHYFPLYWLTTLWYCLPFAGTLSFLRMHEGLASFCFFVGSFMLLAMFVTTRTFLWLALCGFGLSHLGWYAVYGSLPADLWTSGTYVGACLVLGMLALAVLASGYGLERHIAHNLYVKRALAGAVTHEVIDPLEVTSDASFLVFQMSQGLTPTKNASGEKGFFLSEKEGTAFTKIPDRMEDAMEDIRKEFYRYGQMLRRNIYLEKQKKISMFELIDGALPDVTKRYQGKMDVKVTCKQDFEAYMLTELFDTVLRNLVKNAKKHGKATQLEITIDGEGRKVYFRDNGLGIPAELLTRIFDFGFTTSSASNYGIGLPLVRTILDVSGVKIICRSHHGDEDSFTEFVMTFPEV